MTRRIATSAAASALAAGLLLTACGGSGDSNDDALPGLGENDKPAEDEPQETDQPAETDDAIDRPEIVLPDDVELIFADDETGDPELDAVLLDNQYRLMSLDEVWTSGDLERPALGFYSKGDALQSAVDWLAPIVDSQDSFGGTVRYYNRVAKINEEGWATVDYCVDESQAYPTDRETGERREPTADGEDDEYYFYGSRLDRNDEGVWQTTVVLPGEAEGKCL